MPTFVSAGAMLRSNLRPTATQVDRATLRGSPFPLSYKWGTPHYRTDGGCVSHPRRAHNLVQIIVCYNLVSASLPKGVQWYICTFGHWHICISYFSLLSYKWGTPIINIWGTHYRTDGGRCHRCTFQPLLRPIIVQMGDAAIDALSSPSCAPLSYRWGMHCRTNGGCRYSAMLREINLGGERSEGGGRAPSS